jgi:hypothetical protein
MTLEEMIARRDALLAARFRGVRTVDVDGRRITYASDAEMAAAVLTGGLRFFHFATVFWLMP